MIVLIPFPVIPPGLIVHVPDKGSPVNSTLPVGDEHEEGCVIAPTIGAVGAAGAMCIITSADARDIHPDAPVTLKLYVPGLRFEIVTLAPVPDIEPGLIVQVPVAGRPVSITLPVGVEHEEG
jgi:hypothetical protein